MIRFEDFCAHGVNWNEKMLNRMNQRAKRILRNDFDLLEDKRILDLGSRDGRWAWAALQSGASEVVGLEARYQSASLAPARKALSPYVPSRFRMLIGDVFNLLPQLSNSGERFDTVFCLGFYYHIYDHYGLIRLLQSLEPKYIVIDSEMDNLEEPVVRLRRENVTQPNNAAPEAFDRRFSVVGNISVGGMKLIAECLGYNIYWSDWTNLDDALGCDDYVNKSRHTCVLERPK